MKTAEICFHSSTPMFLSYVFPVMQIFGVCCSVAALFEKIKLKTQLPVLLGCSQLVISWTSSRAWYCNYPQTQAGSGATASILRAELALAEALTFRPVSQLWLFLSLFFFFYQLISVWESFYFSKDLIFRPSYKIRKSASSKLSLLCTSQLPLKRKF